MGGGNSLLGSLIEGPSKNSIEGAKGWAGWQECQISGLYDICVESRIGRRRGRVRVECLSAALRGGAKVRRDG